MTPQDARDDLLARIHEWEQAKDRVQAWGRVLTAVDLYRDAVINVTCRCIGVCRCGAEEARQ